MKSMPQPSPLTKHVSARVKSQTPENQGDVLVNHRHVKRDGLKSATHPYVPLSFFANHFLLRSDVFKGSVSFRASSYINIAELLKSEFSCLSFRTHLCEEFRSNVAVSLLREGMLSKFSEEILKYIKYV